MAMSGASPNSFLLKNPNSNRHLFNNPASTTTTHINVFPLNRSSRPNKPISITCSTSAQVQDRPATAAQDRVFNFAAGPAILPEIVLKKAESELYNWRGSGMSVMEMSHRGKEFLSIIQKAEADLRTLLDIPSDYAVLFLQGGATTQFAGVPLNLCKPTDPVDYIVTGSWGDKAFKEASKYCKPTVIWSGKSEKYTKIPSFDELEQNPNARYLHICANETIHGVEFKNYPIPKNKNGLMVADMSSNFCSKPVDVTKFGVIYAGAQKNVGPSGVTIVIIRKDLIGNAQEITPVMLDYKIHAENNSLYNTPPCYGIYMCGLVFEDLLAQGGLTEVEKKNMKKAQILYDTIDQSNGFYRCPVDKSVRSLMNVPFRLEKPELEAEFVKEAAAEKMVQLKGHRSVGGMRASIYNAMPLAGVEKLVSFMNDFQAEKNYSYGTAFQKQDAAYSSTSLAEQQILLLARQQAQREEELAQSQRHILALQEEIEELERENRLHSQQEAVLKEELRKMERTKKREGVDMTYLKNVILKLLETGEVGALLPVIGMLLQFSPDEMQKCQQAYRSSTDVPPSPASDASGSGLSLFPRFSFS